MTETTDCYLSAAIDTNSNLYVAYWNNADSLGQTYAGGNYDVVITKITTNNVVLWNVHQTSYNTTGYGWQPSVTTDTLNNVYVAFPTPGIMPGGTKTGLWDIVVLKLNTNGTSQWVRQQPIFNTPGTNVYPVVVTDYANNVYVAYRTDNVAPGCVSTGNNDIVVFKLDTHGVFQWVRQSPSFNTTADDTQPAIAIDQYGAVYVAYWTEGGIASGQTNTGNHDIVVFKLTTQGITQWVKQQSSFNTSGSNEIPAIVVDNQQNTYVTYVTDGTASGQTNTGDSDIVVFKLDLNGNTLWVQQQPIFNTNQYDDYPTIAVDINGGVYVAYTSSGIASGQTFTGWTYDVIMFKLNTLGVTQWVQQRPTFNTKGENLNPAIVIDTEGTLYVAYPTDGSISGVPVSGPYDIVAFKMLTAIEARPSMTCDDTNLYYAYFTNQGKPEDQYDMVITKKNLSGTTLWQKRNSTFNQVSSQNPSLITYKQGATTYCYVVYQTAGAIVGAEPLFPFDLVVMKMDANGNIIWIKQNAGFNTTRSDEYPSADVDASGNLYVAFQTTGRVANGYRIAFKDSYDQAVFKMDPNGNVIWVRQNRYINSDRGGRNPCLQVDRTNNKVYVAYTTDGRVYQQPIAGDSDIVIFKMNATTGAMEMRPNGNLWILQNPVFNTQAADENPNICVDQLGYLYLCYSAGSGGAASGLSSWGGCDLIIAKFDSTGQLIKAVQSPVFDTSGDETHPSLTYRSGYLYVAYQTTGTVSGQTNTGETDLVIMKLSAVTLNVVWIRQNGNFNTTANETTPSLVTDSSGNCYVAFESTGHTFGSVYQGVMVTKLNTNGSFQWVLR
uniref:Bulb-type lectin domain-containing protein n=1 Tax=viral metagenome TaxID=1070528 RepID=A0A6C0BJJ6_9ZZZZ